MLFSRQFFPNGDTRRVALRPGKLFITGLISGVFRRRSKKISRKGFTLVETVVVIGITGALLTTASFGLFQIVRYANRATISNKIRQNAGVIMEFMEREIRGAPCVSLGGNSYTLKVLDEKCDAAEPVITYTVDENNILTRNGLPLLDPEVKVSLLSFSLSPVVAPTMVTFDFSLHQANDNAPIDRQTTLSFHTTVALRKY